MKKLLNLLLTLAVVSSAMAATVNRQQAREAAAKFMQQKGIRLDEASQQGKKAPAAEQPVYVFNAVEGQGFVIVSGDDRTDAILGYTTEGTYDEDNLPENFREWLNQMTAEIEALQQLPDESRASEPSETEPQQVTIHGAIPPLIATTWNQGNSDNSENTDGVYNIRLPKIGSRYPCTGCVAVCGAQIMYYHKWPQEATKVVPGYNSSLSATSNSLLAKEFEWGKMKTSYTNADAYSDAAYAVADLMLYAGWAANMSYGIDGSSSSQVTLAGNMVEYFGYDPGWRSVNRSDYSVADWDELIYNELANRRPVIYDGAKAANGSGGHAFLCDGYDGEGLYHFNWGWGGGYNGYFKLSATNPYQANSYPGYVFGNSAIIGIQPDTGVTADDPNANDEWEDPVIEGIVANAYKCTLDGTTVATYLQNPNDGTYGFGLGIAEVNDDATLNILDRSYENYKKSSLKSGSYWTNLLTFDLSSYNLPEGKHRLVLVSLRNGEETWRQCQPADLWFEVDVDVNQNVTATQHPVVDIQVNRFEMTSSGIPGQAQNTVVNLTNKGDNISETFYLYYDNIFSGYVYSLKSLKIATGNTKEFVLSTFNSLSEGTHKLQLRRGSTRELIAEIEVDIKTDLAAKDFSVGGDLKFAGATLPVDVTIENHAGDYTMPLYFFASKTSNKGSCKYIAGAGIPAGGSDDVRFFFTPNSGGTWYLQVSTDANGNNIIGESSVFIEEAPSGNVTFERISSSYTMLPNGRLNYTLTLMNTSSTTYYRNVFVYLYYNPRVGDSWYYHSQATSDPVKVEPGEEVTLHFTFEELTEGTEYGFGPQYWLTYSGNTYASLYQYANSEAFTYKAPAVVVEPGDTSGDGELNVEDVNILLNYLTGKLSEEPANADANGDEKVDISDIVFLISKIIQQQAK